MTLSVTKFMIYIRSYSSNSELNSDHSVMGTGWTGCQNVNFIYWVYKVDILTVLLTLCELISESVNVTLWGFHTARVSRVWHLISYMLWLHKSCIIKPSWKFCGVIVSNRESNSLLLANAATYYYYYYYYRYYFTRLLLLLLLFNFAKPITITITITPQMLHYYYYCYYY